MMLAKWCPLFLALPLLAQTPRFEIRGVVLEQGTAVGIEGVRISFVSPSGAERHVEADTDGNGRFRFPIDAAALWIAYVAKDGYIPAGGDDYNRRVNEQNPSHDLKFFLARAPKVTGRVEDIDTREPLEGVPVMLYQRQPEGLDAPGTLLGSVKTTTNSEGAFELTTLNAAPVVAGISPRVRSGPRFLTTFTDEDAETTDEDFEVSYWPGGGTKETAIFTTPISGGSIDLGSMRVRKTNYYRARIAFPAQGCEAGQLFRAKVMRQANQRDSGRELEFEAACGKDLLLTGLLPGAYRLQLTPQSGAPAEHRWALLCFDIAGRNVALTASLVSGTDLTGRFVTAEGAAKLPAGLRADLMHQSGNGPDEQRTAQADADGNFRLVNVPASRWNAGFLRPPPAGWIIRDILYRGVPLPRNLSRYMSEFEWDGAGSIEMVLDDRGAVVSGTVTRDGKPPTGSVTVGVVAWPPPPDGYSNWSALTMRVDASGAFRSRPLPPGEYRLFVAPGSFTAFYPEHIESRLPQSTAVTLSRGGSAQVTLQLR